MDGATQRAMRGIGGGEESASKMSAEPPPSASGGWKTDRVGIRSAENGGFIVDCSKTRKSAPAAGRDVGPSNDYQNKDYAFSSLAEVLSFLQTEFGAGAAPASADEAATMGADDAYEA